MKLLLDERIPRKFKDSLLSHESRTASEEAWAGKKNGELRTPAEESGYLAFITLDRGIEYQENLKPRSLAVILIRTKSNRLADLLRHVPEILRVLESAEPGQLAKVG